MSACCSLVNFCLSEVPSRAGALPDEEGLGCCRASRRRERRMMEEDDASPTEEVRDEGPG